MTGLPTIAALIALNSVLVTVNLLNIAHSINDQKRARTAEANLLQAERKWMECHESGAYAIGDDIYVSEVRKSKLSTRHVPELRVAQLDKRLTPDAGM